MSAIKLPISVYPLSSADMAHLEWISDFTAAKKIEWNRSITDLSTIKLEFTQKSLERFLDKEINIYDVLLKTQKIITELFKHPDFSSSEDANDFFKDFNQVLSQNRIFFKELSFNIPAKETIPSKNSENQKLKIYAIHTAMVKTLPKAAQKLDHLVNYIKNGKRETGVYGWIMNLGGSTPHLTEELDLRRERKAKSITDKFFKPIEDALQKVADDYEIELKPDPEEFIVLEHSDLAIGPDFDSAEEKEMEQMIASGELSD
ncbi:MAG: hypothetical protein V4487_04600 [Chlamydiota bacterium]